MLRCNRLQIYENRMTGKYSNRSVFSNDLRRMQGASSATFGRSIQHHLATLNVYEVYKACDYRGHTVPDQCYRSS